MQFLKKILFGYYIILLTGIIAYILLCLLILVM